MASWIKVVKKVDQDWNKAPASIRSKAYLMVDSLSVRDIEKNSGIPDTNFYAVFKAEGKWTVKLRTVEKAFHINGKNRWKVRWDFYWEGIIRSIELGEYTKLTEARNKVKEFSSALSLDRLLWSEFYIINCYVPDNQEKYIPKFVKDKWNGRTLYTFIGSGAFLLF